MLSYIAAIGLVFLGIMLKYSSQDSYSPLRKYWIFFTIGGLLSLLYNLFQLL